jgi:autotransporter-associated beta strand protein
MISTMKLPLVSCAFSLMVWLGALSAVYADSATWNVDPISGDWNTAANWTPETVPGVGDMATFAASNTTDISLSTYTAVGGISFAAGASPFTFTASPGNVIEIQSRGIINNSAAVQTFIGSVDDEGNSGAIIFSFPTSTAGTNTVFIAEARTGSFGDTGDVEFIYNASAGSGVFFTRGGQFNGSIGGQLRFFGATAADAVVTNEGGSVIGAGGGTTSFFGPSHAGSATLIANGGSNGGGGQIIFSNSSTGNTARVEIFGNGTLVLTPFRSTGLTIGSLEGDGIVDLGGFTLTVGANNLSTTFSGLIQDGSYGPGSFGKLGGGTLILSGANTYTRNTTVSAGILAATNTSGSATGTGPVKVNAGTLGGSGTIAGATTIGAGSGTGAFLAPAAGSNVQATLTIQRTLTFNADATYTCTFRAKRNRATTDNVIANGVIINTGAIIALSGQTQGALRPGLVLTVISNTSANPTSGTFANLPDGAIVTINGNNFQASYEGGDGNDLTLTVVP